MGQYKSEFINRVIERGYMHQCTDLDTLDALANGGTVTSAPVGIDCGADCSETYDYNTTVVLTATPDAGFTFNNPQATSGCGCGTSFDVG